MSAFISIACTDGAFLLTDGAIWQVGDPRLTEVRRKVYTALSVPVAITTKGLAELGREAAIKMCQVADRMGVQAFYDSIQAIADGFREAWGVMDDANRVHIHVSTCLPGHGGAHLGFKSWSDGLANDPTPIEPFRVTVYRSALFHSGSRLTAADIKDNDLDYKGGNVEKWAKRSGLEMMEIMRHRTSRLFTEECGYMIGGQCDFTAITADGCKTENLRTWPDKIGERIDPFRTQRRAMTAQR